MQWSICIPTAGESTTYGTVDSVLSQDAEFDFEIILSGKIPDSIPDHPSLTTVDTGKVPPGKARNNAVEIAKGENIAFIDADCEALPGWLSALDNCMKKGAQIIGGAVVFPKTNYFSTADNVASFFDQTPNIKRGHVETVAALNLACKKSLFINIGPFDPISFSGEDLEWILRAKRGGTRPFFEPSAKCIHHGGRKTFQELINHSKSWGKESIFVRKKNPDVIYTPSFFFNSTFLFLFSPVIGAAFATKIILTPGMLKYAHTWPAIAAAKTAWCLSAASSLKKSDQ